MPLCQDWTAVMRATVAEMHSRTNFGRYFNSFDMTYINMKLLLYNYDCMFFGNEAS